MNINPIFGTDASFLDAQLDSSGAPIPGTRNILFDSTTGSSGNYSSQDLQRTPDGGQRQNLTLRSPGGTEVSCSEQPVPLQRFAQIFCIGLFHHLG